MTTVRFTLLYQPGRSHLAGIMNRAQKAVNFNVITILPSIEVQESMIQGKPSGLWTVILTVPEDEKPFWLGFVEGLDYCRNNRQITVGMESD